MIRVSRFTIKSAHIALGIAGLVFLVYAIPHYDDASFYRKWHVLSDSLNVAFACAVMYYFGRGALTRALRIRTRPPAPSWPWVVTTLCVLEVGMWSLPVLLALVDALETLRVLP